MKYMLLFFADESEWMAMSDEERIESTKRIGTWYREQVQSGNVQAGGRLGPKASSKHARLGRAGHSGKPIRADGPFMEAKESIGSYCIVESPDIEEALVVAEGWPGGGAVQVTPLAEA